MFELDFINYCDYICFLIKVEGKEEEPEESKRG